jgi:hypothetical protein
MNGEIDRGRDGCINGWELGWMHGKIEMMYGWMPSSSPSSSSPSSSSKQHRYIIIIILLYNIRN